MANKSDRYRMLALIKGLSKKQRQKNKFNDKSNIFKQQHPNSEEYISSLLPHALYDGGVAVHEPSHIEYIGSGRLFNK